MPNTTQGDFLNACDKLIVAGKANAGDPNLDQLCQQLETDAQGAREAQARRNFHRAAAQMASRDLDGFLKSARAIYFRLRYMLIGLFGPRAEKLVEFGLKVFRPPLVTPPVPPPVESRREDQDKKKPSENGVEPARTAVSQIDSAS